jgi:hypothetical protein
MVRYHQCQPEPAMGLQLLTVVPALQVGVPERDRARERERKREQWGERPTRALHGATGRHEDEQQGRLEITGSQTGTDRFSRL